MTIDELPDSLLEHVMSFLLYYEKSRLLANNRRLWTFKQEWEKRQTVVVISSMLDARLLGPNVFPLKVYENFSHHVHTLDLGPHCTDAFLKQMAQEQFFPRLRHLRMVGSDSVTDRGLIYLSIHSSISNEPSRGGIETIDITFCRKTTYAGTFCLRDRFRHSLRLLRRQPEWLDGHFYTPFHQNPAEVEVHTYYPDGSFSFTRDNQSRGFVAELFPWNDDATFLGDKLQYTNFQPPQQNWPTWTIFSYRPGVCLLKLPEELDRLKGSPVRTVLVGQCLRGLRPPCILSLMRAYAPQIKIGESRYFNARHEPLDGRPDDGVGIMITKMRVEPLETSSLLPPEDLVADCRTTCEAMSDLGTDVLETYEQFLNEELSR